MQTVTVIGGRWYNFHQESPADTDATIDIR